MRAPFSKEPSQRDAEYCYKSRFCKKVKKRSETFANTAIKIKQKGDKFDNSDRCCAQQLIIASNIKEIARMNISNNL
jgi:hypothetical protein